MAGAMEPAGITLPHGFRLSFHDSIDSTNAEAARRASDCEESGLWIWAMEQNAGRGRAGRSWQSPPGNLHASLLLRPNVALSTALQLSLVAAIAAHDAVTSLANGAGSPFEPHQLRLKWPNDLLIGDAKLGGILLESANGPHCEPASIVIGTGLNLSYAPRDLNRQIRSLADLGIDVSPAEAFAALAWTSAEWIARWNAGEGFDTIRECWLSRAQNLGTPISVKLETGFVMGTFAGIDEMGALRLATQDGGIRRVTAGDVSIGIGVGG